MEPLQKGGILGRVHRRFQPAVLVPFEDVLHDRPGLVDAHIAVVEHRHPAERMAGAVFVGFEVLGVEGHLVDLVGQPQFLQQPDDAAGA